MKRNNKSVINGIENFLLPVENLRVTQADNEGTHAGTFATDVAGREPVFMPFTGVLKFIDDPRNGNAIVLQSVNKVRFANGRVDYGKIMIVHDNDRTGWNVGATYQQGMQIAVGGDAGNAQGAHSHIEVGYGVYTKAYDKNPQGVYHMPNNMPMEEACFADDTNKSGRNAETWNWRYTNQVG